MFNVTADIRLGLPKLNLTGARENSHTPVPKLIGFYENVYFVPRDKFQEVIADARGAMKDLNAEELSAVVGMLTAARQSINEVDFGTQASEQDQVD